MKTLKGANPTTQPKRIIFTMRVDETGRGKITELARRQDVSESEAVRRAITLALQVSAQLPQ